MPDAQALNAIRAALGQRSIVLVGLMGCGKSAIGRRLAAKLALLFIDADVERHLDMIRVHVLASVRLTCAVLPGMVERNRGAVINMSSLCAWTPCAGVVPYSSTKAYLTVFSQGLQDELRETNVRIQALCPGFVHTGFHDTEGMSNFDPAQIAGWLWMMPDDVVECSLKSLASKRVIVIPGWRNRILGRFMQAPIFQPIVRALVRQPRVKDPPSS